MWNEVVANIKDFFNQPVPIIGVTIGFLLIFVLVIFSKTSLGKKVLKKLTSAVHDLVLSFNKFKSETEEKVESLKKEYEEKKSVLESKVAILEKVCLIIAENSHNAKIKEAMEECKEELSICKTDYESLIEEKVKEEKDKIENELKAKYEEFYETYLKGQKEKIEQLVEQAENSSQIIQNKANSIIEEKTEQLENAVDEIIDTKDAIEEVIKDERKEETVSTRTEEETIKD